MAVRELRYLGDPVLTTPADPVTHFDHRLQALVDDLMETVLLPGRAGLAAPQIGVGLRVFSYNVGGLQGYVVNPEIVSLSEETQQGPEGCLSVPDLWFPTRRAAEATVKGVDAKNKPISVTGTKELARCLQHETDHLNGMLYLDRLDPDQRKEAMRQARDSQWFWQGDSPAR
ncbi:peptide deformylase [Kibdelosporangium banguiense]|uniref:Peptide deformylase n=1 Tax=Kibdelosporangium banguiense TaxID=1365924 RepID=A0ABS4U331_9PSEU|nr:peptide deformylase [Kibdelosporangium banguiense]MBP2331080.1 peptide deformylase [Kibdelosporangium banguiense]